MLALCLLVSLPDEVGAQSLDMLSSNDPLGGELAERDQVLERLDSAFVREQVARLAEVRARVGDGASDFEPSEPSEAMARIRAAYIEEAGHTLFVLQGDGSLTLGEVAATLPEVRDRHLRRFENVIEAISRGYEPPPLQGDFNSTSDHLLASVRYTLLERNSPLAWGRVLLCALAGMLIAIALSRSLRRLSCEVTHLDYRGLGVALDSVRLPLILVAAAGGLLVGLRFLWLPAETEGTARRVLHVFIVGLVFLGGWNLCDELATSVVRAIRRTTGRPALEHVRRLVKRVLLVAAFLVVVSRFAFGASFTGMLAGLGVVGVGLWVLMRGVIENVAASFTLFGDGVFRIGDLIVHDGEWGRIEDIGFRSTRCRTLSGHMLHIPNRNLVEETIRNVSARPWVRARFRLSLVYGTSPEKLDEAIEIVHAVIDEQGEAVNRDEGINVVFDAFGEHDLQLLVQYHAASEDYWTAKETMGAVNRALLHRLHGAGIDFAFPTRTTVLESRDGEPLALDVGGARRKSVQDEQDEQDEQDGSWRTASEVEGWRRAG